MKKLKIAFYLLCIFIAIDTSFLFSLDSSLEFLPSFFLYYDSKSTLFDKINMLGFFCIFCVMLFSFFLYAGSLYSIAKKYRSFIVYKYKSKRHFAIRHILKGSFYCLLITTFLISIYSALLLFYKIQLTSFDIVFLVLESISLLLFFILSMCVNVFLSIKYSEVTAMSIVLILSAFILLVDIFVKPISIITYGDINSQIIGIAIQLITMIVLNVFIMLKIKKIDF